MIKNGYTLKIKIKIKTIQTISLNKVKYYIMLTLIYEI